MNLEVRTPGPADQWAFTSVALTGLAFPNLPVLSLSSPDLVATHGLPLGITRHRYVPLCGSLRIRSALMEVGGWGSHAHWVRPEVAGTSNAVVGKGPRSPATTLILTLKHVKGRSEPL